MGRGPRAWSAVVAAILTFYLCVLRPEQRSMAWYRAMEVRITLLAKHQPRELSEAQWAACIFWTWQLHSNYGGASYWDGTDRDAVLAEFDRRLADGADLGTIDWVWDEYGRHTTGGRRYSENHRPTTPERLAGFAADGTEERTLDGWKARAEAISRSAGR